MKEDRHNLKLFGARLRVLRKTHNLTQLELAEKIGLSTNFIGMIERGERNTTIDNVFKLAKAFDITLEEFFKTL